jgi:hypothetical protein
MATVTGNLTLQQLTPAQVAKAYELAAQKKVGFQTYVQNNTTAVQNHLIFSWATVEAFDALHVSLKAILAAE